MKIIGDNFTMGINDSVIVAKWLEKLKAAVMDGLIINYCDEIEV